MDQDCHKITTALRSSVDQYLTLVSTTFESSKSDLRLKLSGEQLAIFSTLFGDNRSSLLLLVDEGTKQSQRLVHNLQTLGSLFNVNSHWHLIEGELSPQEQAGDVVSSLSQTIHYFLQRPIGHHFVVPSSLLTIPLPSSEQYHLQQLSCHRHETMPLSKLMHALVARGYTRSQTAQEPGSFSVRGEHLDIRLPQNNEHYQLTWQGNSIEQIILYTYLPNQQTPRRQISTSLTIPTVAFSETKTSLSTHLSAFTLLKPLSQTDTTPRGILIDALQTDHPFPLTPVAPDALTSPLYVFYENYDRVTEYLREHQRESTVTCANAVATIALSLQGPTFSLVSESALFKSAPAPRPISYDRGLTLASSLTLNKPAVHSDHGIGIFAGLQTRTIEGTAREYLILQYAAGDTLSVPVEYAHKVTPYLGEKTPLINRLGGTIWQKTRRAAEHDAEEFARELVSLAGQRVGREGARYHIQPHVEAELHRSFPHPLTPDQETTLQEIYRDFEAAQPLDRLIVGDVGFGKTEVALRAARHVIANGRQVALLAPTTLLVQQHFDTATERFPDLKGKIGLLSRFVSAPQQKRTRQAIADGSVSLVVGTHALLSKNTHWHNLGLVIVDEEQRFGVKHKEHFKKIRATVDFLSLSATPIPRTLSMALSGLKELSVITTPPAERKEVITRVTRTNDELLQKAIADELARDGQVYIVAPKVRSLGAIAHQVKNLVPQSRLAVAHGQLPPHQLAHIMHQFDIKEVNVLVSSSIIENGLDLPNANTIIVMNAPHFGLSDLYQLRGRVGRRSRQGYAYFLYNQTELTSLQRQRLTALTEASRLGSGWSLAQRDLEIRGAGNLLGAEQSGTVNQVGVQFYLDLVHDAVAQQTNQTVRRHDVDIQVPLSALIPTHYIAQDDMRSKHYQQLSRAKTPEDLTAIAQLIIDTYGQPPIEFKNLLLLLHLQHTLSRANISHLVSKEITPPDEDPYWRISLTAQDVKAVLQKVQSVGTWTVRNNTLTHDLNDITPEFLEQLRVLLNT